LDAKLNEWMMFGRDANADGKLTPAERKKTK
jgi:hypothetical protein